MVQPWRNIQHIVGISEVRILRMNKGVNYSIETFLTCNWIILTIQIGGHGHEGLEHRAVRVTVYPYLNVLVRYLSCSFRIHITSTTRNLSKLQHRTR